MMGGGSFFTVSVKEAVMTACHDADMSVSETAEYSGMHPSNLYRAIGGVDEGQNMKVSTLLKILETLGAVLKVETDEGKHEMYLGIQN